MAAFGPRPLRPFTLERFFSKHEFTAPYLACCSDCEPLRLPELLALATDKTRAMWDNLRLGYTETQGLPELREAVAQRCFTPGGVIRAEHLGIMVPEEGIYLTMRAVLSAGDHVVVTEPGYQSLAEVALSIGCEVTGWEPELLEGGGCKFDLEALVRLLRPNTKMVVINFPHNPTGAMLSRAELDRVVDECASRGAWLFSDEMYRGLEADLSTRLPCAAELYPKAISLGGASKAFALPGLRVGWVATQDKELLTRVLMLKDFTTICTAAPSEILALIAVEASDQLVERNRGIVRAGTEAFSAFAAEFPGLVAWEPPAAGSTAFPRLLVKDEIEAFCDRVVAETGVLLLPGSVYDHAPSTAGRRVRIGLGRRDFPDCLERLKPLFRTLASAPSS